MLNFKSIELTDYSLLKKYLKDEKELSCENSFPNLFLWHGDILNKYLIYQDALIIKTQDKDKVLYRLPIGSNFNSVMELLRDPQTKNLPDFYCYEGETFKNFRKQYGDEFEILECRDEFEYIYKSEDLINLSGKKFHSKRNHISSFSKKYNWRYERITEQNIDKVNECAKKWYLENAEKSDDSLSIDKNESKTLIKNMESLDLVGGAIFVDEEVVAFTIGTSINDRIFDIMVEKALPEFATAYAVINREFAKNELFGYEFINREDDMGIEGLRKAKLSYKPEILLKKYYCYYKGKRNEKK